MLRIIPATIRQVHDVPTILSGVNVTCTDTRVASVDILVTHHNRYEFLSDLVASLRSQTYTDWRLIFVDDGSIPAKKITLHHLQSRISNPIVYVEVPQNHGVSTARNFGLFCVQGKYLVHHDSDDISYPNRISDTVSFLEQSPHIDMVGGLLNDMNHKDLGFQYLTEDRLHAAYNGPGLLEGTSHGTLTMRSSVIYRAGYYIPDLKIGEDQEYMLRAIRLGCKVAMLPIPLIQYRRHSGNSNMLHDAKLNTDKLANLYRF